jgi:prepilin-type N-terminal cleavage/methylation domain-containing protein/prepilin-type processing-associated H-X9-DG protein
MKNNHSGFTLIELLVVVAIIGVLAGLMIPSLSKMQERGRAVACVSNLRQLHVATMNYAAANGDLLPHTASEEWSYIEESGRETHGTHTGWVDWFDSEDKKTYWWNENDTNGIACIRNGSLFEYLGDRGDEKVYMCPSMLRLARKVNSGDREKVTRSYGMNGSLQNNSGYRKKYSDIEGPARTIMFADQGFELQGGYLKSLMNTGDSWTDQALPGEGDTPGYYIRRTARNHDGCIDWRHYASNHNQWKADAGDKEKAEHIGEYHDGRGNAIFCDGHVERIEFDETRHICQGDWEYGRHIE